MDIDEKQEVVENAIESLEAVLSELEQVRECKRIYDMIDRARVKLDELSGAFDQEDSEDI